MEFDFSAMAKRARAQVSAPDVPMNLIVARSREARRRSKVTTLVLAGATLIATIGTAAAFGTSIYDGVHFWLSGNKASVVINSLASVNEPTADDLRSVIARATFPIVLPVGLPAGTHIWTMQYAPIEHPNVINLNYQNEHTKLNSGFTLFDSSALNSGDVVFPTGSAPSPFQESNRWQLGPETVLVLKRTISLPDMNGIKAAMMRAGPAGSLATTESMLSKATILGIAPSLPQIAERYAPSSGHTVVIGPQLLRSIPELAKRGQPMLDMHIVYLSDIPLLHGQPDYANAVHRWPRLIAVSASGVRAINTVFRSKGVGQNCNCAVLFNESNGKPYSVWEISQSSSTALKGYSIDTRTFAVSTLRRGQP